jgi:hypothetical protein
LPRFHLFPHRFEVSLHSVNAHRDAIDERERLRVFREYGRKHTRDSVTESNSASISRRTLRADSFLVREALRPGRSKATPLSYFTNSSCEQCVVP